MDRDALCQLLAEFFRDQFVNDPVGVMDWLMQGDNNADDVVFSLDTYFPAEG